MIKPIKSQKSIVKPLLFNDEWQTIKLQFSMDRIFLLVIPVRQCVPINSFQSTGEMGTGLGSIVPAALRPALNRRN